MNEGVASSPTPFASADARVRPASPRDPATGPRGLTERFPGGGRVALGAHANTAVAGRDLLVLWARPAPT